MFLRSNNRKKDGKDHRCFSIVENHRLASNNTVQRTVSLSRRDQRRTASSMAQDAVGVR